MSDFTEYKTSRTRKNPEDLVSSKDFQINARRLYLPIDTKKYGLSIQKWEEEGKKKHKITWKTKPYGRLLLNNNKKAKDFVMIDINTQKGIAIQVDPSNFKKCYISIPKGAMEVFPKEDAMLDFTQNGAKITVSKK